jgi:D-tyrosyl-tRNA(Tyr) deacylase
MKAIIQRVSSASVSVDGVVRGSAEQGFLVLLGVTEGDSEKEAELLARKTAALRIFCDSEDKMNLSLTDIGGDALVVSNFTLCADTKKGNRPSFINAMAPDRANELYEYYCEELKKNGVKRVEKGVFGADMKIAINADGPVTITLDTDIWSK